MVSAYPHSIGLMHHIHANSTGPLIDRACSLLCHRVKEIETPALLHAWQHTLNLITSLPPDKIIPGHIEACWQIDGQADRAHTRKYPDFFATKVMYATTKPQVAELFEAFKMSLWKRMRILSSSRGTCRNNLVRV